MPDDGARGHGMVSARLFAGLEQRSRDGRAEAHVPLAAAPTVAALCAALGLPEGVTGLVLVNGLHADLATPLSDGDEVALFPPVGGG